MINRLAAFADELRTIGIPVSMVEVLDAANALQHVDLETPDGLRAALGATMIKSGRHREAFDRAFDVFFVLGGSARRITKDGGADDPGSEYVTASIADALDREDMERLLALIREAVDRFGRSGAGATGGASSSAYRVLRRLDPGKIRAVLFGSGSGSSPLDDRLAANRVERLMRLLRAEVRREVTRRMVDERGAVAVARSVREPLIEDLDLQHATRIEIDSIQRAIAPLARKLATRLSQRRRHGNRGRLDVRRTIRRSLGHGGALIEPRLKSPRIAKPRIVLLCDTSGSMVTFSRFAMQLIQAIASELSGVRSFVFIEGVDEATNAFGTDREFDEALALLAAEADVVRHDGHSDYGRTFSEFAERYVDVVTTRTTVIITGDARSNYRNPSVEAFKVIADRARAVFWLNPEPQRFWNTGDSIMGEYAPWCDRADEVRTLRQLETFIESAALANPATRFRGSARVGRTTLWGQPF